MTPPAQPAAVGISRADYGIDAPGVIRNLLVAAAIGLGLWGTAAAGVWSGWVRIAPTASIDLRIQVASAGLWTGLSCLAMAIWMIWSSKVGKVKERETLLDRLSWTGREQVLDVGCGRGLMLIGAAKRLTTGLATGIDIWQAEDLSGNRPEATLENAARERV
jgi:arsenite methyltransferase